MSDDAEDNRTPLTKFRLGSLIVGIPSLIFLVFGAFGGNISLCERSDSCYSFVETYFPSPRTKCHRLAGSQALALEGRGGNRFDLPEPEAALRACLNALTQNVGDREKPVLQLNTSYALIAHGRFREALHYLRPSKYDTIEPSELLSAGMLPDALAVLGYLESLGQGISAAEDRPETAYRFYEVSEKYGSDLGRMLLGWAYIEGDGIPRDAAKGLKLIQKSAARNLPGALNSLGWLHSEGIATSRNKEKAAIFYKKAVKLGLPPAMIHLANMYITGWKGQAPDHEKALRLYETALEKKSPWAAYNLGRHYKFGLSNTQPDPAEAVRYFRIAYSGFERQSRLGYRSAWRGMAQMHHYAFGRVKNIHLARQYYTEAAKRGDRLAMSELGRIYAWGIGVATNRHKAEHWLRAAADRGQLDAKVRLAMLLLYRGSEGHPTRETISAAVSQLEAAVTTGSYWAKEELGKLLIGRHFAPPHVARGLALLKEAVDDGSARAAHLLAVWYALGHPPAHILPNPKKSIEYFSKAIKLGNTRALLTLYNMITYRHFRKLPFEELAGRLDISWIRNPRDDVDLRKQLMARYRLGGGAEQLSSAAYIETITIPEASRDQAQKKKYELYLRDALRFGSDSATLSFIDMINNKDERARSSFLRESVWRQLNQRARQPDEAEELAPNEQFWRRRIEPIAKHLLLHKVARRRNRKVRDTLLVAAANGSKYTVPDCEVAEHLMELKIREKAQIDSYQPPEFKLHMAHGRLNQKLTESHCSSIKINSRKFYKWLEEKGLNHLPHIQRMIANQLLAQGRHAEGRKILWSLIWDKSHLYAACDLFRHIDKTHAPSEVTKLIVHLADRTDFHRAVGCRGGALAPLLIQLRRTEVRDNLGSARLGAIMRRLAIDGDAAFFFLLKGYLEGFVDLRRPDVEKALDAWAIALSHRVPGESGLYDTQIVRALSQCSKLKCRPKLVAKMLLNNVSAPGHTTERLTEVANAQYPIAVWQALADELRMKVPSNAEILSGGVKERLIGILNKKEAVEAGEASNENVLPGGGCMADLKERLVEIDHTRGGLLEGFGAVQSKFEKWETNVRKHAKHPLSGQACTQFEEQISKLERHLPIDLETLQNIKIE